MHDSEGLKTTEESNCRCGENSKRTDMRNRVWKCDRVAPSSWWNLNKCRYSSYVWVKKWFFLFLFLFFKIDSTPGEDTGKIFETTWKDIEYFINLVFKTVSGFERTDSNFERSSTVGKMLSKSISFYREIICERFLSSMWQT